MQIELIELEQTPELDVALPHQLGDFQLGRFRLMHGKSAGCELAIVDFGKGRAAICPTRGMSLWKAELDGIACGWNSPVRGPVHPSFVPVGEPSGLGWLDGFDELLVRCGLASFGAPDFDAGGRLTHPLHGRIGNLPAEHWTIEHVEDHSGQFTLIVRGQVRETRFLFYSLRLAVEYRFTFGQPTIGIHDRVTNDGGAPAAMQLLYHINFGAPLLSHGARLELPVEQVEPRDARAVEGIAEWASYRGPTSGFNEQVYFSQPNADHAGWVTAKLLSADATGGIALRYKADTLPYFTLWKNTAAEADGYVTGLEPGTGYPNTHSIEKQHGRLIELSPGESREFRLNLSVVRH